MRMTPAQLRTIEEIYRAALAWTEKLNVQRRGVEETGGRIRRPLVGRRVGQHHSLRSHAEVM